MGMIRSSLFVVGSVCFFITILVSCLFLNFGMSLDYDVVKPNLVESAVSLASQIDLSSIVEEMLPAMQMYCAEGYETYDLNVEGRIFTISCGAVSLGTEGVINDAVEDFVEQIYYKDYDCGLVDCVSDGLFAYLISEQAKEYWDSKFYLSLLVILSLAVLLFLLAENKSNAFIVGGALTMGASILFIKTDYIISWIVQTIISNAYSTDIFSVASILEMTSLFFEKSYTVFLIFFILGIIALLVGIVMRFFQVGFWISNFVSKFKKEDSSEKIVESNVKKSNATKNKDNSKKKNSKSGSANKK